MYIYTYLINQKFSTNFLWVLKFILMLRVMVKNSNLQQVGGRSNHNVPPGPSAHIFAKRGRRPSLMGWDGWDGWDGTEYQKCPLIFFILCEYVVKPHVYLYVQ